MGFFFPWVVQCFICNNAVNVMSLGRAAACVAEPDIFLFVLINVSAFGY